MDQTHQTPLVSFYRRSLGDAVVYVFNDGYLDASFDLVTNIHQTEAKRLEASAFRSVSPLRLTANAFVIENDHGMTLIDAGGAHLMPAMGLLAQGLAAAGIESHAIKRILLTHMHPDHIGGLLDQRGKAVFPDAELVLHQQEAAFWFDPATLDRVPEESKAYVKAAQAVMHGYEGRIRQIDSGDRVAGIEAVPAFGHTPGHTGWLVNKGRSDHQLLIWGDIVHLPGIQFANPQAGVAFDANGAQAAETRRRLFDHAIQEKFVDWGHAS